MSDDNKNEDVTETVETTEETTNTEANSGKLASFLALKEEKPTVFFGGIAGVAFVVVALLIMSSGSSVKQHQRAKLVVGQSYSITSSNSTGKDAVTPLVKVPGSVSAYDRNVDDNGTVCLAKDGTRATVKSFADAFGKKDLFVEVEVSSSDTGDCKGKTGWLLMTNLS